MLALADQDGLHDLAALILKCSGMPSLIKEEDHRAIVLKFGKDIADIRIEMMQQCYQELYDSDPGKLVHNSEFPYPTMNLIAAFQGKFGPMGSGEPVRDDSDIINPLPDGDTFLTVAEARGLGVWCDWHEQPHERWGGVGDQAFCRQCHAFMQASLSPRQWRVLTVEWLGRMERDDKQFYADVCEDWTEGEADRYFASLICAQSLIESLTPHEVVDRLQQESISRSSVEEK